jgi:hypothetical protein
MALTGCQNQIKAFENVHRALTSQEATTLTGLGLVAVQAIKDSLAAIVSALVGQLNQFEDISADKAIEAAAEALHTAFRKQEGTNKIADLKSILGKTKSMADDIKKYVDYAAKTKGVIKAAVKFEDVSKAIGAFGDHLKEAQKTLGTASDIAVLMGRVNPKFSGVQNDIARFQKGIDMLDTVLSKTKIPLFADYWTKYVKPATERALKGLEQLGDMVDASTRNLFASDWWKAARQGSAAPSLADAVAAGWNKVAIDEVFPDGQPMLDFMWSVFRGPVPTSAPDVVAKSFLKYRKQFNEGNKDADQLKTDADWTNVWRVAGGDKLKHVMEWVEANKDYIWACEYGALSHP